ncbi:MAG: NAD+ synthase [Deltaproteobacteria bacterium]
MEKLRVSLAQINPTVGDLAGNTKKIIEYIHKGREQGADIVAFPEMAVTGYPPEDLLLKPGFIRDNLEALKAIQKETRGITAVVGFVDGEKEIYNAAAVLHDGALSAVYRKMYLPNYSVFDEERYFKKGKEPLIVTLKGIDIGISICEDIWYPEGPVMIEAMAGAEVIININASPFYYKKWKVREEMVSSRAADSSVAIAYVNAVGGQDELIFDGHSMVFDRQGNIMARGRSFEEEMITVDIAKGSGVRGKGPGDKTITTVRRIALPEIDIRSAYPILSATGEVTPPSLIEEVYNALVLGTRDYMSKNGFKKAIIALSGGIDSALVAAIAVEAIGADNVTTAFLPSYCTSRESREDAEMVARNLGIKLLTIHIRDTFESYLNDLKEVFSGVNPDTTEENLQARTRGNIIMALSNKFGWLVLTTGNKSEMSVGYATLYGDMAGGFAVIKDVPKTMVYELCRYINSIKEREIIPETVLTKAPTAELKPNQRDQDTLPPYDVLDSILKGYIEENKGIEELVSLGFQVETVRKVIRMVDSSEYKRRQAAPGIKITPRALGKDWRMPITNRYESS